MQRLMQFAGWLIFDFRCSVGMALLCRALRVLPPSFSICEGIRRGIGEQTEYDRYAAYTLTCGAVPVDFDHWREQWRWLRMRPAGRCKVLDTSRIHLVREKSA